MDANERLRRKLARTMTETISTYGLLKAGDRVLVAISGGKDSYTMLSLLAEAQRRAPFAFELFAFHLDQGQPGYDGAGLHAWLTQFSVPFEIQREDTYSIVMQSIERDPRTLCAPCSRLRRGLLSAAAARHGCNKIALGHHRDDALETLLLNLFYQGRLQAMPARYTTDDGRFEVIRPLIECAEVDIATHAVAVGYPIIPCNLCGSQPNMKRDAMAALIANLEAQTPDVRNVMLRAIQNVRPTHLLDTEVAEAWAERPAHVRPRGPPLMGRRLNVISE